MTDLLPIFHSFPPDDSAQLKPAEYDTQIRNFLQTLSQATESVLVKAYETQPDLLDSLDPSVNTLPYLKILLSVIRTHGDKPKSVKAIPEVLQPGNALWNKITFFLESFDPTQVRYVGYEWRSLVEFVDLVAGTLEQPRAGLGPIRTAILRLDPSGGTLTSNHVRFLRLVLRSHDYGQAAPLLDFPILGFPLSISTSHDGVLPCSKHALSSGYITLRSGLSDKMAASEVQEYFLLGAMAYLGMRRYEDALLYLEHVLTTPTHNVATGLMLEAYKKWILVSYLVHGKVDGTPKAMNNSVLKVVRSASRAYEVLGGSFFGTHEKLQAEAEAGVALWAEDGNTGLVHVFVQYHIIANVRSLANIYSAIPISEIGPWIGMGAGQTEAYLRTLIADELLNASIEGDDVPSEVKVLRFYYDPTTGPLAKTEKQRYAELVAQAQRTTVLTEQVRAADHRLNLTKEYLEHLRKKAARGKNLNAGPEEHVDSSWEPMNDADEDIMTDLH